VEEKSMIRFMLNLAPSLKGYCYIAGAIPESSKAIQSFYQVNFFKQEEDMATPVNCMSVEQLSYFIYCEVNSFMKNNAMWNTLTVERHSVNAQMVLAIE
jgi:hypothetical protein